MAFQAFGMLESAHDVLLERLFQLVFLRLRPPPAILEEESVASDGIVDALTVFDLLPWAVGKRIVRCGVVTDSAFPRPENSHVS
jgi:hypothetical protein